MTMRRCRPAVILYADWHSLLIDRHHVTIARWRHRSLAAAANDNTAVLSGVIEG
jgi:hypothetical protein